MIKKSITNFPNAPDIESSTRDYATRFNGKVGAWFLQQQKDASQNIIHGSDLKVLDVGGGHGHNIKTISELGLGHALTIYGSTDSSTEMIQSAIDSKVITFETGGLLELPVSSKINQRKRSKQPNRFSTNTRAWPQDATPGKSPVRR